MNLCVVSILQDTRQSFASYVHQGASHSSTDTDGGITERRWAFDDELQSGVIDLRDLITDAIGTSYRRCGDCGETDGRDRCE